MADRSDHSGNGRDTFAGTVVGDQPADADVARVIQDMLQAEQRMITDIQPEHLPFQSEPGALVPLLQVRHLTV